MSQETQKKDRSEVKTMLDHDDKKTLIWANAIMLAMIIVHDSDHVRQAICWNYQIPIYLMIVNISAYLPSLIALVLAFKKRSASAIATIVNGCLIAAGFAQVHLWKSFIPVWGIWNNNFFILGADAISWTILAITIVVGVSVAIVGAYVRGRCSVRQAEINIRPSQFSLSKIPIPVKLLLGVLPLVIILWIAARSISYGGDFTLNFNGKSWTYSQSAKKLNILYFGYPKCGDVCPMTLTRTSEAFRKLSDEELKHVQFIFVSIDSEHGSPEESSQYAMNFFPQFIGLSGDKQQIDKVVRLLPAAYFIDDNVQSTIGYSITHTDKLFFMDPSGKLIDSLSGPQDSVEILKMVRKIL